MARNFGKGISWKKLGIGVVAGILILASIGGVFALFGKETKTIGPGEFKVGALDENGEYVKNEQAIYTEESFACAGLKVTPDFEAKLTYDVYYYDVAEKFLGAEKNLTEDSDCAYPGADFARIVIYPDVPDGEKAKDFKVNLWEIRGFAKQLDITVDREQSNSKAVTKDVYAKVAQTGSFSLADVSLLESNPAVQASDFISVDEKCSYYRIYVKLNGLGDDVPVNVAFMQGKYLDKDGVEQSDNKAIAYNAKGQLVNDFAYTLETGTMNGDVWYSVVVETPEEANYLRIQGPADAQYRIYGVDAE